MYDLSLKNFAIPDKTTVIQSPIGSSVKLRPYWISDQYKMHMLCTEPSYIIHTIINLKPLGHIFISLVPFGGK